MFAIFMCFRIGLPQMELLRTDLINIIKKSKNAKVGHVGIVEAHDELSFPNLNVYHITMTTIKAVSMV